MVAITKPKDHPMRITKSQVSKIVSEKEEKLVCKLKALHKFEQVKEWTKLNHHRPPKINPRWLG